MFEAVYRRSDFEDGYASDASYVTVDDEFDTTIVDAVHDDDAGGAREFSLRDGNSTRDADRRRDDDGRVRGPRRSCGTASGGLQTTDRPRRNTDETDVKMAVSPHVKDRAEWRSSRLLIRHHEADDNYYDGPTEQTPTRRRLAHSRTSRVDFWDRRSAEPEFRRVDDERRAGRPRERSISTERKHDRFERTHGRQRTATDRSRGTESRGQGSTTTARRARRGSGAAMTVVRQVPMIARTDGEADAVPGTAAVE